MIASSHVVYERWDRITLPEEASGGCPDKPLIMGFSKPRVGEKPSNPAPYRGPIGQ